jgi:pyrimidine operon attenuation protein / uracil phosphoribosyltransferase
MNTASAPVLSAAQTERIMVRIAHEIHENHYLSGTLILVGIEGTGTLVRDRIAAILSKESELNIITHNLKLNKDNPLSEPIAFSGKDEEVRGRRIVLVDDVLNSGRTLMFAAGFLLQFDPPSLGTVVLVDRIHRAFPIRADYVGITLSTNLRDHVSVRPSDGGFEAVLV